MTRWPSVPLGDAIELAYGKSLPKSIRADGGSIPVYGSNGITGWHSEAIVHEPTVIVGRKGSAGAVQYVDEPCYPIDTTYFVRARSGFEFNTQFLFYVLRWLDLSRLKTATGVPGLSRDDAYRESIPVPPIEEQLRIVDILSRAEGIVRLRREAQQKAAELIPAIFIDMFGDPATNSRGWPVRPLGDLLEMPLRNGISPARSGRHSAYVLTLSAITQGQFDNSAVKLASFASPITESDEVCTLDFLICRGNGNKSLVGVGCFPNRHMRGVAFPDTAIAARPNRSLLAPHFLSSIWQTAFVRRQIDAVAKTTNGTFKINQTGVAGIRLIVPPMSEQLRFGASARAVESLAVQQAAAQATALAAFDALLSRSFGVPA